MQVNISVDRPLAPDPPTVDLSIPTGITVTVSGLKPSATIKILVNGTQVGMAALDSSGSATKSFLWAIIPLAIKNLINLTSKVGSAGWSFPDPGSGSICSYTTDGVKVELSYQLTLTLDGSAKASSASSSSLGASLTTTNPSDAIFAWFTLYIGGGATFSSISDDAALTWTLIKSFSDAFTNYRLYRAAASSALTNDNITVKTSINTFISHIVWGVNGPNPLSPLDPNASLPDSATGNGVGGRTVTGVSTTNSSDMLLAVVGDDKASNTYSATDGTWTMIQNISLAGIDSLGAEYKVVSAVQSNLSVNFPDTQGAAGDWGMLVTAAQGSSAAVILYKVSGTQLALNPAELAKKDVFDEAVSQVGKNTIAGLFPLWMASWAENLEEARRGDSLDKLYSRPASERVLIIGRGPSIFKHGHLDLLAKHPFPGEIISSDGAMPLLAERRITPTLSMTVDGNPVIAKWFTGEVANIKVRAVIPLTVHPKTVAQLNSINAKKYWYIPELDQEPLKGITETLQLMTYSPQNPTGISRANGAGCAGNAAVLLGASILRAKEIVLIGMTCGYDIDTPLSECHYHGGMLKSCGYDEKTVAQLYRVMYAPAIKGFTVCDPIFETYRVVANTIFQALKNAGVKVINCTQGGCLYPDTVEAMPLKDYLDSISTR